ncbi:hypothetical protein BDZ91DRAFT_637657, partial [Kalaharituber pfeilii]
MSARLLAPSRTGLALALSRRPNPLLTTVPRRLYTPLAPAGSSTAGGLLRIEKTRGFRTQLWSNQIYRSHSNAVRALSFGTFGRVLPKIVIKFARVPALFGASMVAGLAYIQYQVQQAGQYTLAIFQQAGEKVGNAYNGVKGKVGGAVG